MRTRPLTLQTVLGGDAFEQVALDISRSTPFEGITGVTPLMDSLAASQDVSIGERARIIFSLDEASQMHARSYIERFLNLSAEQTSERRSLWALAHGYWVTVLESYGDILDGLGAEPAVRQDLDLVAQVVVRTIRAGVLRSKWEAFNGCAMDQAVWARLNGAYALAIRCRADRLAVHPRADRMTETTAEREYLRAMALQSIGMEQFDPARVEAATSLVHYVLPLLELSDTPDLSSCYWVDVAGSVPPTRLITTPDRIVLPRFFSGAAVSVSLRSLLDLSAVGSLPPGLPPQIEAGGVMASVLSRMVRVWANEAPMRLHRRMPMDGLVVVAEGLARVVGKLTGGEDASSMWRMRDASKQGLGLDLSAPDAARLRLGTLIGFRPTDGEHWCIGVIRRIKRLGWVETSAQEQVAVGVELLGRSPEAVSADDGSRAFIALLLDPLQKDGPVRIVVPDPGPSPEQPLFLVNSGKTIKLIPIDTMEYGVDFVVRAYQRVS